MPTTRVFKSGNSQAVRIPKDLQYDRLDLELEIERHGDELRIHPVRRKLTHLTKKFRAFSTDFMSKGREK
jgi:antitoxin VapB